ncbi:MAG TPA: NifU family protein [Solirubrobacteraceae bacterium]|jgi:Fe-S cluster biogenesis protein NfuA/nitrite reductase/ring-hydroxylating ferredoxin subunit|nr:NifU family protein [Solirubrobacteraceae bacterium]
MDTAGVIPGPEELVQHVQELQERLEAMGDAATREVADALVSAVVQMYGAGLERIVELLAGAGEGGRQIASSLSDDALVATLLLIHDLHPVPLEDRVQAALDSVRPYMESHGGNVELLSLRDGVATIHLRGSCSDCSASAVTLELAIKQALEEAAPDLEALEVLGVAAHTAGGPGLPMVSGSPGGSGPPTGMELPVVMAGVGGGEFPQPSWVDLESVAGLADGTLAAVSVAGSDLVVANVDGTLLAYHDRCANCGAPLHEGLLSAGALACPECQRSFFLPRAGRSLDDEKMQLEPVPLLRDEGRVKVALTQ